MWVDVAVEFSTETSNISADIPAVISGQHDNFRVVLLVSDVNQGQSTEPIPTTEERYHVMYTQDEQNKLQQGTASFSQYMVYEQGL